VQPLLNLDELQGMSASDVDGAFDQRYGSECSTELVDLWVLDLDCI